MASTEVQRLQAIRSFPSLVKYLRDELDWPIESDDFDELTFDYEPEELGIDSKTAVKIKEIKQLRPLDSHQPWGIFFVNFEPKRLPIVVLRRILRSLVVKKRSMAVTAHRATWQLHDLLFISSYGESEHRELTFAHFNEPHDRAVGDLPTLKVLGWDAEDTVLRLDHVVQTLSNKLRWPEDGIDPKVWREHWSDAFVLRPREVIRTSRELAVRLADLAKSMRKRANEILKYESETGTLRKLHKAFQTALIHDLTEDDFADMYAQTIAYGLLASSVSRPMGIIADNLKDMVPITNPFLKEIMGTFLSAGGRKEQIDFDELGIQEIVDLLNSPDTRMEDILRDFGNRTMQEDPVIHFYELFLKEYDRDKKVNRGVFYTPQPVVSYIVRSVHQLLQTEFGLEDGLAATATWGEMAKLHKDLKIPDGVPPEQPFVQILDPATGTATFLVQVIETIHNTMVEKWKSQGHKPPEVEKLWNEYVPRHLLPRMYGYELMMAPYAIAHMKIGLKLAETGYDFASEERVNIYLTNALEPATEIDRQFNLLAELAPALAHEAQEVNEIKRKKCFTVVVGNPPYSFRSTNKSAFVMQLLEDYRKGLNEKKPQLNDDYVKFIRLGQFLLAQKAIGVLGMITNNSYLYGITHRRMRESLCESFSRIRILDLGGDTKFNDSDSIDENVFDIRQGVCVGIFARNPHDPQTAGYCRMSGTRDEKYGALNNKVIVDSAFKTIAVEPPYYFAQDMNTSGDIYHKWLSITEILPVYVNGIVTSRDAFCVDKSKCELSSRLTDFVSMPKQSLIDKYKHLDLRDNTAVKIETAQRNLKTKLESVDSCIKPCSFRPFDEKLIAYDINLIHRTRKEVMQNLLSDNIGLVFNRSIRGDIPGHFFVAKHVVMKELISSKDNCYVAPVTLLLSFFLKSQLQKRSWKHIKSPICRGKPQTGSLASQNLKTLLMIQFLF